MMANRKSDKQTVANEFLPDMDDRQRARVRSDVEMAVNALLNALRIDWENDPNTKGTAERIARMYVDEVMKGRFHPRPKITVFPNTRKLDEMYTVGPITVRSMCSHHLVPIIGNAWIGVIPGDTLIGLSKFHRLTDWIMSRPQIQEEAAVQLADEIESLISPKGLAVVVKASHLCTTWRGVMDKGSQMTTSIMRGLMQHSPVSRTEFLESIKGQGYASSGL